jgi:hypothetical protein
MHAADFFIVFCIPDVMRRVGCDLTWACLPNAIIQQVLSRTKPVGVHHL